MSDYPEAILSVYCTVSYIIVFLINEQIFPRLNKIVRVSHPESLEILLLKTGILFLVFEKILVRCPLTIITLSISITHFASKSIVSASSWKYGITSIKVSGGADK